MSFHEAEGIVVPTSPTSMRNNMAFDGVGWSAAVVIGGLARWLAGMMMKSNTGIMMNIILGVVGQLSQVCCSVSWASVLADGLAI